MRYDCLGAHGHPLVRTPNLDRLAAEGRDFSFAFSPQPVCSPARACLATGAWATTHGCLAIPGVEHYQPADPKLPVLSELLHAAGYFQAHIGKFHGETAWTPDRLGVDVFVPESDYAEWRSAKGRAERPSSGGWLGEVDPYIVSEESRLAWGAGEAIAMIRHGAKSGRPFFIRWDPSEPHLPNCVPEPFATMYPSDSVPPWPSANDPLDGKPFIQAQQRRTWGVEDWAWKDWAPIVGRYLGEITLLDQQVGRLLEELDRLGLHEQTLVVFTSDHGDFCGGHGMIDKHYAIYDDIVRVPLLMRWPGLITAGETSDAMIVHEIDLARSLIEVAGIEAPPSFVGHNVIDLTSDNRPDVFAQYHGAQFGLYSERMVRDRKWKYVWNPTDRDELYDLDNDPGERHNRARDPQVADRLAGMRRRLVDWMQSIDDPLANPWTTKQLIEGLKP